MTEKEQLIRAFNQAFAEQDTEYLIDQVSDNIVWEILGEKTVKGKDDFAREVKKMKSDAQFEYSLAEVITHGRSAAANGTITMILSSGERREYAFCDVYRFSGFKNPKFSKLTSYCIRTA